MRNYLIGAAMIAATALLVYEAKAAEVIHGDRPGMLCKTQQGIQAVFAMGDADSNLALEDAVTAVNDKLGRAECTMSDPYFEKKEKVGEISHMVQHFDILRIALMRQAQDTYVQIGEAFACFPHGEETSS